LDLVHAFTANEFVKGALFSAGYLFLIKERQTGRIELLEPLGPTDFAQRTLVAIVRQINTNTANMIIVALRANYDCRFATTRLCPAANFFVVGCNPGFGACCHIHS